MTLTYYAIFVALGLAGVIVGPTLQGLAAHTGTRLAQISAVFTLRSLGYMTGSYLSGRIYDRVPGHPVMAAMMVIMAVAMALMPVIPFLWMLVAVIFVLGVAQGGVDVGGNIHLMWVHGRQAGPFMNGLHFCWGLGAFLSPIIVARAILASGDITWAYWVIAVLILPPIVPLLRLPTPTRYAEAARRGTSSGSLRLFLLIVAFFLLYVGAEATFGGWIFTYAVAQGQTDKATAAYLTSLFWGALTLGRLIGIPVAARLEPHALLAACLVGCVSSIAVILFLPAVTAAIWVGAFGAGLFMGPMFPTMLAYAEQRMTITGKMTGWFLVGSALGGMSMPWLVGQLFETIGPYITIVIAFVDMALAAAAFAALLLSSTHHVNESDLHPDGSSV
jgi:MFS transporter, FHS family, Na+ dependent glucose transporter 1